MAVLTVTTYEAKSKLSALLTEVGQGNTVIITRHGKRIARLVPEPAQADYQAVLSHLRTITQEAGIEYSVEQLTDPLPPEAWGEFGDPGAKA